MRIKNYLVVVAWLLLGVAGAALAQEAVPAPVQVLAVERLIQLPDGKPAAGAKVLLRTLNSKDGTLKQEKRVVADEQGVVRAEIESDESEGFGSPRITGYMVVDVPGMALAFEKFENWRRRSNVEPLRLSAGYQIKGKVLTRQAEPVENAEIILVAFASNWSNWRINYPVANILTPEATTRSKADGSFEMRPVDIVEQTFGNGPPAVRPLLAVRAVKGDKVLVGSGEVSARAIESRLPNGQQPANPRPEDSIRVYPAATVRGRVVNALDGQPIAGAQVVLRADAGGGVEALLRPAVSGQDGAFEFVDVPPAFQLFAEASHEAFAGGWTQIGEKRSQIAGDEPNVFENLEIRLRPWAKVSGRVIDVATKAAPLTPISIFSVYDEGYNDGRIAAGRGTVAARADAEGRFEMRMPVGYNHVSARGAGYWEGGREHPIDLDIKPAGEQNLLVEVRREKGFLTQFSSSAAQQQDNYDFDREYDLHIRGADGKESATNWGRIWYWPLYQPEDTLEIRVTHFVDGFVQEVVPWTKLTSSSAAPNDPQHWPRQIWLPLRQTVAVRGKVVDAATGKPMRGAQVNLESNPEVAVKNIAPVTTGEDGAFAFANVPLPGQLTVKATLPTNADAAADAVPPITASARVGAETLAAVVTQKDEGHQEFNDIVIKIDGNAKP